MASSVSKSMVELMGFVIAWLKEAMFSMPAKGKKYFRHIGQVQLPVIIFSAYVMSSGE
jgi:hypothetical protein